MCVVAAAAFIKMKIEDENRVESEWTEHKMRQMVKHTCAHTHTIRWGGRRPVKATALAQKSIKHVEQCFDVFFRI